MSAKSSGTRSRGPRPGGGAAALRRDAARRSGLPRRTAYDVLAAVRERAAYANLLLPRLLAERQLTGRDAALTTELAYGTLRGQGSYDAVLAACSDRRLDKLDPPVLDVLRLGTHQLLSTRVGDHAAVTTSVDLAKSVIGPRVSGYVNAVLRRVATRDFAAWLDIIAPDPAGDPDGYLAVRYSHPRWVVASYRDALGPVAAGDSAGGLADGELALALEAGNVRPRVTLAALPGGAPREEVMPPDAEPGRWSPYAFTLAAGDPAPLLASGAAAVQDEGSQLAAIALARAPLAGQRDAEPERWLDLCAGPGGKARLLYGLAAQKQARLTAAELHPHRASLVADALRRASRNLASLAGAVEAPPFEVLVADGTQPPWPGASFERVLVDAPCTGLGALRRRPEARWRKSPGDLAALTRLQRALLSGALDAVRPGGVVAYVTCSPVPAETSDVVTGVADARSDVEILDTPAILDVPDARSPDPRFAQLWPHRHGTDAIFVALLRRTGG